MKSGKRSRNFWGTFITAACVTFLLAAVPLEGAVVFADGEAVPIVLAADVTPTTEFVAGEMAGYMERMTGVRPEIVKGVPDPLPSGAIWVGHQPVMDSLFAGVDFGLRHPEEILLVATDRHVAIVGRDRWDPAVDPIRKARGVMLAPQQEYGTANAIYTVNARNV